MKKDTFFQTFLLVLLLATMGSGAMAQDIVYEPVLTGDTIRWTVPQISMAEGCWTDEMIASLADSGRYELWYKERVYNADIFFCGELHASEDNARLYIHPAESEEEFLIMDLNLSVNDTFHTQGDYGGYSIDLIVDSVFVFNERKHIRFARLIGTWFSPNSQEHTHMMFIEGVGPNWGLREKMVSFASPFYFICKYNGDLLCYVVSDTIFENCDFREPCIGDGIAEIDNPSETIIYPNPFYDIFTINSHSTDMRLVIYDCSGRVCLEKQCLQKAHNKIDMHKYPAGIYFVCLLHKGKREFYKIIKSK